MGLLNPASRAAVKGAHVKGAQPCAPTKGVPTKGAQPCAPTAYTGRHVAGGDPGESQGRGQRRPPIGGVARGFGVGGWDVLDRCSRRATFAEAIAPFRRLVGTTSARERPLRRARLLTARDLPPFLAADPPDTETALVFGPEDSGLTGRQLEACHPLVAVPADRRRPTLNLAQSVLILAYELHLASCDGGHHECPRPAPAAVSEFDSFLGQASRTLARLGYDQEKVRGRWIDEIRRLLKRAGATSREVRVFRRLVNRVHQRLGGGP